MQYLNKTKNKKKLYRLSSCEGGLDIISRLHKSMPQKLNWIEFNLQCSLVDLLNLSAKVMNFTYVCNVPPPDNAWESLQEDGSWNLRARNGMVYN